MSLFSWTVPRASRRFQDRRRVQTVTRKSLSSSAADLASRLLLRRGRTKHKAVAGDLSVHSRAVTLSTNFWKIQLALGEKCHKEAMIFQVERNSHSEEGNTRFLTFRTEYDSSSGAGSQKSVSPKLLCFIKTVSSPLLFACVTVFVFVNFCFC